jgi:hypothetical protein
MLTVLDAQISEARHASEIPDLAEHMWGRIATTVRTEISALDEPTINQLRNTLRIPPERYREELEAFQAWMAIAHSNADNPVIVRAQVMTELYVAFVWLRDSVIQPVDDALASETSIFSIVHRFLSSGRRRRLRNAIAHGRWCYQPDFDGLDCWDGKPPEHFAVSSADLHAWQTLSRGTAIATILALTEDHPLTGSAT